MRRSSSALVQAPPLVCSFSLQGDLPMATVGCPVGEMGSMGIGVLQGNWGKREKERERVKMGSGWMAGRRCNLTRDLFKREGEGYFDPVAVGDKDERLQLS